MVIPDGVAMRAPLGPVASDPLRWTDPPLTVTSPFPRSLTSVPRTHRPQDRACPGLRVARASLPTVMVDTPARAPKVVRIRRCGMVTRIFIGAVALSNEIHESPSMRYTNADESVQFAHSESVTP